MLPALVDFSKISISICITNSLSDEIRMQTTTTTQTTNQNEINKSECRYNQLYTPR